jgi:hypothetical protein
MSLNNITKYKNVIDKTERAIYIFFHVVLTLDFGYIKPSNPKMAVFVKACSTLQVLCYSIVSATYFSMEPHNFFATFWFCLITTTYLISSLILIIFNDKYSFSRREKDFAAIDSLLASHITYSVKFKFLIFNFIILAYRIFYSSIYRVYAHQALKQSLVLSILITLQQTSSDILIVKCCFIFYGAYYRLKILNSYVKTSGNQIYHYLLIYKSIVSNVVRAKKVFDCLVSDLKNKICLFFNMHMPDQELCNVALSLKYCSVGDLLSIK